MPVEIEKRYGPTALPTIRVAPVVLPGKGWVWAIQYQPMDDVHGRWITIALVGQDGKLKPEGVDE